MPDREAQTVLDRSDPAKESFDTLAGVVVGAHGVQGTVKVKPVTDTSESLFTPPLSGRKDFPVWVGPDSDNGRVAYVVSSKRQEPKNIFLVRFVGIDDRTTSEKLIGQNVYGSSKDRVALSEDEYFVEDLIGMRIVDRYDQELGVLQIVHNGVANDVYETDRGLLIPAVKAFIDKIDLSERKITVFDAAALTIE